MALRGSLVTTGSVSLSGSVQAASTQFTGPVGFQDDANVTGSLAIQSTTMLSGALYLKTLGGAPSVQATNESVLYSSEGALYWKNAGGTAQQVGSGGGGAPDVGWTGPANDQITTTGSLTANQQINVGGNTSITGSVAVGSSTMLSGALFLKSISEPSVQQYNESVLYSIAGRLYWKEAGGPAHHVQVSTGSSGWTSPAKDLMTATGSINVGQQVNVVGNASVTGSIYAAGGLSGSLQQLTDDTSYLVAGDGITIASASNGQVTITGNVGDITGVTAGTGLTGGGTSGGVTLAVDDSVVATVSGAYFHGQVGVEGRTSLTGSVFVGTSGDGSDVTFYGGNASAVGLFWDEDYATNGRLMLGQDDHGVSFIAYGNTTGRFVSWDPSLDKFLVNGNFQHQTGYASFGTQVTIADRLSVTGSIYAVGGLSGSLQRLIDDTSYLVAGSNVTITSASNGQVTIASSGGGGGAADVGWTAPAADQISTTGSLALAVNKKLYFDGQSGDQSIYGNGSTVYFDCDNFLYLYTAGAIKIYTGGFIFNENGLDEDLRVETDNLPGAIITDGGTDQVILGSAGTTAATAGAASGSPAGSDVLVYISGSVGSAGVASSKGTTMVAGDMHVSGALYSGRGEVTPVLTQCLIDGSSVAYQEITNNETTQYRITWDLGDTSATDPYVTFTAPESGQVLVYVQSYIDDTSSSGGGPTIYMALSTSSAASIAYNDASIVGSEKRLWYPDEADDIIITANFLATGLTPGNSYTYYPFLRRWTDGETNRVICGANYPMFMMEVRPVTAHAVIYNS